MSDDYRRIRLLREIGRELARLRNAIEGVVLYQRERDQQTDEAQQQFQPHASPIEVNAEIHEPPAVAGQKNTRDKWHLGSQWAIAIGTWLAFAAAAYYAGVSRSTLLHMRETANQSQRNEHLEQRAWIAVDDAKVEIYKRGVNGKFWVRFKNTGKTPAVRTREWLDYQYVYDLQDEPDDKGKRSLEKRMSTDVVNRISIAPQGTWTDTRDQPEWRTDASAGPAPGRVAIRFDETKDRRLYLYIFGEFRYWDIWGDKEHGTRICFRLLPDGNKLEACKKYNDMD